MGIHLTDFIVLFLSGTHLLSLGNLGSVILFSLPLLLSIQRKYFISQVLLLFSAPVNLFLLYLIYAQDIGIHFYLLSEAVLAIFILKHKQLIYLTLAWVSLFFLLITISIKYHWFTPFSAKSLVWVDFFWWNNVLGAVFTTIAFTSIFKFETFDYEAKMQRQNLLLADQKQKLHQSVEELKTTQEFLEQKQHEITQQNKRIEQLYDDLSDSIDYAQNIQQAILPTTHVINQWLPNSFILFQPKNVVSGDFYYLEEVNGKIIVAAIDCTGHGVPGAFMSIIGNNLLNKIVKDQQITNAATILETLHLSIQSLLRQKETNNRDGMDAALVVIDAANQVMEFAGAKNPLVYIQDHQLQVIKGDKTPIGGEQRETTRAFTLHRLALNRPTTFYLFSDGFQDQFGGPHNKKFSPARLRDLLLASHQQPADIQRSILKQALLDWQAQGQEEQIDDVLLIGVHI